MCIAVIRSGIPPHLSVGNPPQRGGENLLLLWWASLLLPGAIAALPVLRFLRRNLDHSTRAREVIARLDGPVLIELWRQLAENGAGASIGLGLAGGALALLFVSPFAAGAMVAAARSDEPLRLSRLLAGAGELYGRMLRTLLAGLIPLGIGSGLAGLAYRLAARADARATLESAADRSWLAASAAAAIALFLCHLLVDGARAQFAAEPGRRSAVLAVWSSLRLLLRRPVRMLGVGVVGALAGLGGAAALMAARSWIVQGTAGSIACAWILAQGAQVAIGWGRAVRIFGLAELAQADAAARSRTFQLEPPGGGPLAPQSDVLSPLSTHPAAPLSPGGASDT